jgi:hypothetical protein
MKQIEKTQLCHRRFAVALAWIMGCTAITSGAFGADDNYEQLKSRLGSKDQMQVARALSQAAALAKVCQLHIADDQFQSAMQISGIEAQDLADGGKLHAATQEGVGSIDEGACHLAKDAFGPNGYEIPGVLN